MKSSVFNILVLGVVLLAQPVLAQTYYQSNNERTVLCATLEELSAGKSSSKAHSFFVQSIKFFVAKNNKAALVCIDKALQADPAFGAAYVMGGFINADLEQPAAALTDFERGVRLDPKLRTINVCDVRSRLYIDAEKWDLAIADISQSIILQPMPWRFKMRGELYATKGKNDLALSDFDSAIKLTPKNSGLYRTRADFFTTLKRYKEAIADYTQAIKLAPDDPSLYGARANAYEKSGRHDLAAFDRAKSSEQARETAF